MDGIIENSWILYIVIINLISSLLFIYDKNAAKSKQRRISEKTLHLFEFLGGVLINIVLMYTIKHKNSKFSYYFWTWIILIAWIISVIYSKINNRFL